MPVPGLVYTLDTTDEESDETTEPEAGKTDTAGGDAGNAVSSSSSASGSDAGRAIQSAILSSKEADVRLLPIGGGYPATYPLADILSDWNPDVLTIPRTYGKYQSLRIFDYQVKGFHIFDDGYPDSSSSVVFAA
jgi:hypothetical protein